VEKHARKKCKNKESSFPSIVKLFDDKNEVHDMFKILGALKEKIISFKKNQNEDLETHKVHLDTQIDFSKNHIYINVFKRF
jgi:hypothetical protein